MRLSKPNSGETKIDNRTISKNSQGNIVNLDDFKLDRAITFYERFSFNFNKYSGGRAHLSWAVNANTYLKRYSNGVSGKYRLTSKIFTNEELNSYINEFGQGCFLSWYLEVTSKYTTYPVFMVEKEFNCDLPRTLEGETGEFLPLASVRLFMNENNELDEYNTQVFRYFDNSIPAESFVHPYYWEYQNYAEMEFYYTNVPSGQLARVLDNSDAPEPTEGWAVYQQDYNNKLNKGFKLVSLQPKENKEPTLKLSDFMAMNPFTEDYKIIEDFDITLKYSGDGMVKTEVNNRTDYYKGYVRIKTPTGDQFLQSGEAYGRWDTSSTEDRNVYFTCWAYLKPDYNGGVGYPTLKENVGATNFQEITPTTRDEQGRIPIYQIRVSSIGGTGTVDLNSYVVVKHWKNALKHNLLTDNKTAFSNSKGKLTIPGLACPIKEAYLLEDFDFEVVPIEQGIQLKQIGGRRNIPVMTKDGIRYFGITEPTFSFKYTSSPKIGANQYWGVEWKMLDNPTSVPNGHVLRTSTRNNDYTDITKPCDCTDNSAVLLLQVNCLIPKDTNTLKPEDFQIRKL